MTEQLSNGRLLHQQQNIKIFENNIYRWLCFDDEQAIQSCMSRQKPTTLNLAYQPYMMMWRLLFQGEPQTACLLGLGGGDIVRYLQHQFPAMTLLVAEKNAGVAKVASQYFEIKPDQKALTVEIADAEVFIQKSQQHDLILVDIVTDNQLPEFLYTDSFWKHCHHSLSEKGMVVMNVIPESEAVFLKLLTTIKSVFGCLPLCMGVPDHKNIVLLIVFSTFSMPSLNELKSRGERLQDDSGLPYDRCLDVLEKDNSIGG